MFTLNSRHLIVPYWRAGRVESRPGALQAHCVLDGGIMLEIRIFSFSVFGLLAGSERQASGLCFIRFCNQSEKIALT